MSMTLKQACEQSLLLVNKQKQIDNQEIDEYEIAPFIYDARNVLLQRFLRFGTTDRNYGSGTVGALTADGYSYYVKDVAYNEDLQYHGFELVNDYLDAPNNAGVVIVPLGRADHNPYVQVPFGTQWNSPLMNMEDNVAWWVTGDGDRVQFYKKPGPKVGLLIVETVSAENTNMEDQLRMPPHLHLEVITMAAGLFMQKKMPDKSNNAVDHQPGT